MTIAATKVRSVGLRGASEIGSSKLSSVSSVSIVGNRSKTIAITFAHGKSNENESTRSQGTSKRAKGAK